MRVGIVGVGRMGVEHLKSFALVPGVDVVAVSDVSTERAHQVAGAHGIERVHEDVEALVASEDVDAVDVVVPPGEVLEIVQAACAHAKPVMCEKPLGVDAGQARAMLDAATAAGVAHALCHQRRYDPVHRYVRDLVGEGFVGAPRLVDVRVMTDFGAGAAGRAGWIGDGQAGGGMLMQLLSHYVDLLHFTFGDLSLTWCDTTGAATARGGADDTVVVLGELPGGGRVSLVGGWALHHPAGVAWQIYGSDGTILVDTDMHVLGGRAGEALTDLGVPDAYRPAVGAGSFSAYGDRMNMGWADNIPMLASLAAEFAGHVAGGAATEPLYATFADGLWFHDAIARAAGPGKL